MNLERLLYLGFDRSGPSDETCGSARYLRVACSCCEALAINGVPCHERGCSNQSRECPECEDEFAGSAA